MKILTTKWAIQHKKSSWMIPEPKGKMGRGGSWVEPVPVDGVTQPRLFNTKLAAQRALTAWLMGKHEGVYSWESDDTWGNSYRVQDGVAIIPVENRKREDMDIVEVHVVLLDK